MFKFGKKENSLENNRGEITLGSVMKNAPFSNRYFEIIGLRHTGQKGPRGEVKVDTLGVTGKLVNFEFSMNNSNRFNIVNRQGAVIDMMQTSPIISVKEELGSILVETKNTLYIMKDVTREVELERQEATIERDL